MITVVLISIGWTTWLIILTLAPNETANYLMNTESFDGGQFWLIVDPDPGIKFLGVAGYVVVDAAYVYVLIQMVFRTSRRTGDMIGLLERKLIEWGFHDRHHQSWSAKLADIYRQGSAFWRELTGITGKNRKIWVWQSIASFICCIHSISSPVIRLPA